MISNFKDGKSLDFLSEKFNCTKLTITRNLKNKLGDQKYKEFLKKSNFSNDSSSRKKKKANGTDQIIIKKHEESEILKENAFNNEINDDFIPLDQFVEISPLNQEIDYSNQKDVSSKSLSEINFPSNVFLVVKKEIELETKYLRDYPEWQFLPQDDLNRKTIEVYYDPKTAKRNCTKDQKVIKVPNTDVFRIVSPILLSRGISRIVSEDELISL